MKKPLRTLPVFLACCFGTAAYSQDKLPDFGKIDIADLQIQECPFDKSASAMNLIKTENIGFEQAGFATDPRTVTEYRVRIKIFNESGFKYASIIIPWSGNSHSVKITDVEAVIYTLDDAGRIATQKVEKDQIFKEKSKSEKSRNSIRFTFPNLKKGAVVEYRYKRFDKNSLALSPWFFQDELPTMLTKCSLILPSQAHVGYHIVASYPVEKDSSKKTFYNANYNEDHWSFAMHDVPAFKAEPFMSSLKDNLQRVEFSLTSRFMSTFGNSINRWKLYNGLLIDAPHFGMQFDLPVDSTGFFIDSVSKLTAKEARISAVYGFVKKCVAWNNEQSFYPADIAECWKDKTGSSAEMNLLLLNLLRKAGVVCFPALISTRDNGLVDHNFASMSQFNGVDVVAVDSNRIYILDCTQKHLSYQTTPYNVLNREAFIIDRLNSKWVKLADDRALMQTALDVTAKMDSTGLMKGKGRITYTGIAKAEAIQDAEKEEKEKEKESSSNLAGNDGSELKIDSSSLVHDNDDNDTLVNNIIFHCTPSSTGDIYFINPFMFSMFKKNPLTDSLRMSDIDFGSNQVYKTGIRMLIPKDFSIEEVPKSIFIRMSDSSVMFKREIITSADNQLLIRNTFTVNRALFDKEEYDGLKSFFGKVYALINEQIVLKKKE